MDLRSLGPWLLAVAALSLAASCAEVKETVQEAGRGLDRLFGSGEPAPPTPAQAEDAEGLYRLGLAARERGDAPEALRYFRAAGEAGHGPGAYEASRAYVEGLGTERDLEAGAAWTNRAAALGEPRAQFLLGAAYYGGIGVERDYERAVRFLAQAAAQGHAQAQYLLGEAYSNGRGVAQNMAWAARWYGKAAAQGLAEAQYAYGVVRASGLGLPVARESAYGWLLLASGNGVSKADIVHRALATRMTPEEIRRAEAWADRFRPRRSDSFADPPTVMYVQQVLNALGYPAGPVDGRLGPRTRGAIARYQETVGLPNDGELSPDLLDRLRVAQGPGS